MALVKLVGATRMLLAFKPKCVLKNLCVQRLIQGGIQSTGTGKHHTSPNTVALDPLNGIASNWFRNQISQVVEFVAKFDQLGAVRNVRHVLHLRPLSGIFG